MWGIRPRGPQARLASSGSRAASVPAAALAAACGHRGPMTGSPAASTPSGSRCCGRCCSPSPTRSSARQPNPTTCCRTATCGGPRWTWRRCGTPSRIWPSWSPGRRSTRCGPSARRREDYVGPWLPEPLLLDEQRRLGRRRAGRVGVDGDAGGARDARAPTSGRCSCCARCSGSTTTRSPRRSASPRRRCARSRTAPASTCRPDAGGSSPSTPQADRARSPTQFLDRRGHRRRRRLMAMLAPGRGVDRRQRRQGQRGPPTGRRRREGRQRDRRPVPRRGELPDVRVEPAIYNSAPALVLYLGDQLEGVITDRDHRRPDHQLLRDAQPGQAGRRRRSRGDQPLASSVTLRRCGSSGSATWAAPLRCCARSPTPPTGAACRRRPR